MTVKQAESSQEYPAEDGVVDTGETNRDSGSASEGATQTAPEGPDTGKAGPVESPAGSKIAGDGEDIREALVDARERIKEMEEGHLRAQAEVENIRRRSQNEIVSARKFALEAFTRELLVVKDSLDQAANVELEEGESEAVVRMQEGLDLTLKQLDKVLEKFDVVEVEAGPGVKFNPDHHQAISLIATDDVPSDHIVNVMQKGFLLKDRLLRPAMVVVAS
jgi:molecular chaperone GrpE